MISTGEVGYDVQPGQNSSQCGPCASPEPSTNDTLARLDVPNPFSAYHNFVNCKSGALLSITAWLMPRTCTLIQGRHLGHYVVVQRSITIDHVVS